MRSRRFPFILCIAAAALLGCDVRRPLEPARVPGAANLAKGGPAAEREIAVLTMLPSLGGGSEALAVNDAGTVVVGHSFDRAGRLYAVKWTQQGGSWVIIRLAYPGSARAMGVDNQGAAVGYFASWPTLAVLWSPAGVSRSLDCAGDVGQSVASGISGSGQVVVGRGGALAALWRTGTPGSCRESLPTLAQDGFSHAVTVNGDGTIVGGSASLSSSGDALPVRWSEEGAQWLIEQLDTRRGSALGANAAGDLAGFVAHPCVRETGCPRAIVWYAAGGLLDLGTLGAEWSHAYDINSAGEVVGVSTTMERSNPFFWSASLGALSLPAKGTGAGARAVSEVRPDATRLVVGKAGSGAAVWLVRNP